MDIKICDRLSRDMKSEVTRLVKDYIDLFAANPRKPKQTTLFPVIHKPHRILDAWEKDIYQQVSGMLLNGIIYPSSCPCNAPVILVKYAFYVRFSRS